jgi:hypothetical protein
LLAPAWQLLAHAAGSAAGRHEKLTIDRVTGLGRAIFAAVLLIIGGLLNIIYGCGVGGHRKW